MVYFIGAYETSKIVWEKKVAKSFRKDENILVMG